MSELLLQARACAKKTIRTPRTKASRKSARRGVVSDKAIREAIRGSLGNMTTVARRLGVSRMTVWRRLQASEELRELYDEENETLLDRAENELAQLMDPRANEDERIRLEALKYYLDCKGKARGYGRRPSDGGIDGTECVKAVQPVIVFEDHGEGGGTECGRA